MRKVSVIAITATYLDMTFATTANITSVVETGGYFVHTVICTIIWESFPMSLVNDMKGELMSDLISRQVAISAICSACGKIDCDKMDKCEKLQLPPANNSEIPNSSDTISRQAAIEALSEYGHGRAVYIAVEEAVRRIEQLPSTQPEIIRCRECKFASGDSRICMKFDHSPIGELDFCSFAERREVNNETN
jgi:hypothetical protein